MNGENLFAIGMISFDVHVRGSDAHEGRRDDED